MVHFQCRQQVIVRALVAVRLDVAQGHRVRACLVHQGADTPFMVPGERTVDCIDEGQPTNERHGVELLMAQRVNIAPRLISVPLPSPAMTADAMLAGSNRVGGLARRLAVDSQSSRCGHRRSHRVDRMVPGATHLFEEEAGALEPVASLASSWFTTHLSSLEDTA